MVSLEPKYGLPLLPDLIRYMIHTTPSTQVAVIPCDETKQAVFLLEIDKYGDSFTNDTNQESLKEVTHQKPFFTSQVFEEVERQDFSDPNSKVAAVKHKVGVVQLQQS